MYNTIIFDLDDTLTNDFENIKYAFKILLEYRNEKYTDEKFLNFYSIDDLYTYLNDDELKILGLGGYHR